MTAIEPMPEVVAAARRLYADLRVELPGIQLAEDRFVARLTTAVAAAPAPLVALEAIHHADLYVAQAAAAGDHAALIEVDRRLRDQVTAVMRSLRESRSFAEDLESSLRDHLLVPRETEPARLASYAGSGPLDGWLRVTATREAVRARRGAARDTTSDDALGAMPAAVAPELDYLKVAYRDRVRAAFSAAIRTLDDRQQNLIRLHYGDGVGVERLGQMYQVHFSTISRWISAARDKLFEQTRSAVRAEFGVDDAEFEEIMGLVQSRLDLTISLFVRADR